METEFYSLLNTVNCYKRSIIRNLEKIHKNISGAVDDLEATYGQDACMKKYNLSQEMVKIIQLYVEVFFLTENAVNNLPPSREDCSIDDLNSSICSIYRNGATNSPFPVEIKQEIGETFEDGASQDSDVTILVDITNNLLENEYGNRDVKEVQEGKEQVQTEANEHFHEEKSDIKEEIDTEDIKISEKEKSVTKMKLLPPVQSFSSTNSVKSPLSYRPIIKNPSPPNYYKKTLMTLSSKSQEEQSTKKADVEVDSFSSKSTVKPNYQAENSNSNLSSKINVETPMHKSATEPPPPNPPIPRRVKSPKVNENSISNVHPKIELEPVMDKSTVKPSLSFPSNNNVNPSKMVENSTANIPSKVNHETLVNKQIVKSPSPNSPTPRSEKPFKFVENFISNDLSKNDPESHKSVIKPSLSISPNYRDVKFSNIDENPPSNISSESNPFRNKLVVKPPQPVKLEMESENLPSKELTAKNISNNIVKPPSEAKTPPSKVSNNKSDISSSQNSSTASKAPHISFTSPQFTAVEKLLNMTFYDRKKEAEKRYEGYHPVEDFKWKVMPKNPTNSSSCDKKKSSVYNISEDSLRVNQSCIFSCINTPAEFYVRTNQELFQSLENSLNEDLNKTYQYVVANYQSKHEAKTILGNFCSVFLTDKHKWFRAEVVDWMMDDGERVLVQLIDYGDHYFCRYKNLKALMQLYSEFPKMAIKCHFAGIHSPIVSDRTQWPQASIDLLNTLSEMDRGTEFLIIFAHKEGDSYAVDLTKNDSDETVAQILIRRNLAVEEELLSESNLHVIPEEEEEEDDDDLVEFDGINEAITGYDAKDEARICPFTDSSGRCFKGPKCKLEHKKLSADGITTDQVLSATQAMEKLQLPATGDKITILITGYVTTCHFYAQIIRNRSKSDLFNDEFQQLKDNINAMGKSYEPFKVYPGLGEAILVKHNNEWHRAKCVDHEGTNSVHVFLVDYGVKLHKKMEDVRQIKDDLLYLPFQAVECMLDSCCEISNAKREDSWSFFQNCMQFQNFTAYVVDNREPLQLKLWDANNMEMDYVLKQYALGQDRNTNLWLKDDGILTVG